MKPESEVRWYRRAGAVVAAGTLVAGLTACAVGGDSGGEGETVPAGASKEQYAEAFADADPISLTIQSNQGPGVGQSVPVEAYAAAVEEWSGGKIDFEIVYAGAIAPIQEAGRAMADGLVDMAFWSYSSSLDNFPVSKVVQDTFFVHDTTPLVGPLELLSTGIEQTYAIEELREEVESQGIYPLLPLIPTLSSTVLCTEQPVETLDDAKGKNISPSGRLDAEEFRALGFSLTSIPYAELFDAMQRGVIDCVGAPETSMLLSGILEVGDHWSFSPSTAQSGTASAFDVSLSTWESLPLPARQLLFDRLDVFISSYLEEWGVNIPAEALREAAKQNVELHEYDPGLIASLQEHQQVVLDDVSSRSVNGVDGSVVVENAQAFTEKWRENAETLGLNPGVSREEFPDWAEANQVDLMPWAELLMDETLNKYRPE